MSNIKPIEELFQELIELPNAEMRQSFLDRVGGYDAGLRQQLEGLAQLTHFSAPQKSYNCGLP